MTATPKPGDVVTTGQTVGEWVVLSTSADSLLLLSRSASPVVFRAKSRDRHIRVRTEGPLPPAVRATFRARSEVAARERAAATADDIARASPLAAGTRRASAGRGYHAEGQVPSPSSPDRRAKPNLGRGRDMIPPGSGRSATVITSSSPRVITPSSSARVAMLPKASSK